MKFLLLMLCLSGLLLQPAGAESGWQKKIDQHEVQIFQRHLHPKYKQKHTKGLVTVNAQPSAILALLKDTEACPQWVYACLKGKRLADGLILMAFDAPLWFKDRDLVIGSTLSVDDQTGMWTLQLHNHPNKYIDHDYVRIKNFSASWLLKPVNNHQTQIIYEVFMDPEISPKAGVDKYNRDAMLKTLVNLKVFLESSTPVKSN